MLTFALDLLAAGGFVMWPLYLLSLVVWTMLGWQALILSWQRCDSTAAVEAYAAAPDRTTRPLPGRGWQAALCAAVAAPDAHTRTLDVAAARLLWPLDAAPRVLPALVNAATLLGLLGTVVGMIDVFNALQHSGIDDSASLAGGIEKALLTTQVGLVIAVPALFAERRLRRHTLNLRQRLEETRLILRRHLPDTAPADTAPVRVTEAVACS